jgi:ABC-type lipoprotein release transport system permease subunit
LIAWRNLWRNRRRTLFTAGGIAFACLLLLFSRSMQLGSYKGMIDAATGMLSGHIQVQHDSFFGDPKLEYVVPDADALAAEIARHPEVVVASPRAQAFALLSVGEKSFGAQVIGVVPETERDLSTLLKTIVDGSFLAGEEEAVIGSVLARNLGAGVGDELLVLGSGKEGGVAALALTIAGIFDTGQAELDRALVIVPLQTFREGFYLDGDAHQVVVKLRDVEITEQVVAELGALLPAGVVARSWRELLPDVVQGIALDRVSARLFYGILVLIVLFSIINTFVMTVFERTREFGMLLAIGMHPWRIIAMLQLEALWIALLGGLLGALLAAPVLVWLVFWGIPTADIADLAPNVLLPSHIKGAYDLGQLAMVPLIFIIGCQVAALAPGLRILHLRPVEALRAE